MQWNLQKQGLGTPVELGIFASVRNCKITVSDLGFLAVTEIFEFKRGPSPASTSPTVYCTVLHTYKYNSYIYLL